MKLKERIKSYSFWVSLSSAVILLIRLLGEQFGFSINENLFSDIFTTLCGILVILGIIAPPTAKSTVSSEESEELTSETETNQTNSEILSENDITSSEQSENNIEESLTVLQNSEVFEENQTLNE